MFGNCSKGNICLKSQHCLTSGRQNGSNHAVSIIPCHGQYTVCHILKAKQLFSIVSHSDWWKYKSLSDLVNNETSHCRKLQNKAEFCLRHETASEEWVVPFLFLLYKTQILLNAAKIFIVQNEFQSKQGRLKICFTNMQHTKWFKHKLMSK